VSHAAPAPGETLLFVYGTLRRGGPNHALLAGARFVGGATTAERYALFVEDFPYLAPAPAVHHVRGEVYAVDAATLAEVDRLEGHPTWYERRATRVVLDAAARAAREGAAAFADAPAALACETYFNDRPRGRLVPNGDYASELRRLARAAGGDVSGARGRRRRRR
jgi:gamma-glutamylaminecyclotransferase